MFKWWQTSAIFIALFIDIESSDNHQFTRCFSTRRQPETYHKVSITYHTWMCANKSFKSFSLHALHLNLFVNDSSSSSSSYERAQQHENEAYFFIITLLTGRSRKLLFVKQFSVSLFLTHKSAFCTHPSTRLVGARWRKITVGSQHI